MKTEIDAYQKQALNLLDVAVKLLSAESRPDPLVVHVAVCKVQAAANCIANGNRPLPYPKLGRK